MIDAFHERWLGFVRRWTDAAEHEGAQAALVRGALEHGLDETPLDDTAWLPTPGDVVECEMAVVIASGLLDQVGYFVRNPDLIWSLCDHPEVARHFCGQGWKEMRNPQPDFDLWWYWAEHLDPTAEQINPVVHYAVEGRRQGLSTMPAYRPRDEPPVAYDEGLRVRRICLFAGFDAEGRVDDYVVAYLRDLSRFADIYYLADCSLRPGELDKIAPYTRARWAERHGLYDFGSYSRLARDLVGWDVIEEYDELILANDSAYAVQSFETVFERMDRVACDWWGLQATFEKFTEKEFAETGSWLSLEDARAYMEEPRLWRYSDYIHVGSYFLTYRAPIIADPGFRARLDAVARQTNKTAIILKYEIGFSRYLTMAGFAMGTFVDGIAPYHPIYQATAFELMGEGFPLLKRQFLYENPFSAPDLVRWKERLLEQVPDADVAMFEDNLHRVSPVLRLWRSFAIVTLEDGSVSMPSGFGPGEFEEEERWLPKFDHWWAFAASADTRLVDGNVRAVFEAVKDDASLKKILLVYPREGSPGGGVNVERISLDSAEGQWHLLRSKQIFVTHGPRVDIDHPLSGGRHNFVNVRDGIRLLRFGASVGRGKEREAFLHDTGMTRAVVATSERDRLTVAETFSPVPLADVWPTGWPRNDFVLGAEATLPADFRRELERLRAEVAGRRVVLYLPSTRSGADGDRSSYRFDDAELAWWGEWCRRHDVVLGVRSADAGTRHRGTDELESLGALDLSQRRFPNVEVLYREAAALVSDYHHCLVDFLVTGRPVVSFAFDLAEVRDHPGFLHDLETVLPGPVCEDFAALRAALEGLFEPRTGAERAEYDRLRSGFFEVLDDRNAARVIRRVKGLYLPLDEWETAGAR